MRKRRAVKRDVLPDPIYKSKIDKRYKIERRILKCVKDKQK